MGRQDIPANVIQLRTDSFQQVMLLGGLSELMEAFEVGFENRAILDSSECNIGFHTSAPLINAAFHLQNISRNLS